MLMMLSLLRWFFFFHATQSVLSSRPFRLGQWLPSDWNVTDEWLANMIHECQCKYKDKLEMLLALQFHKLKMTKQPCVHFDLQILKLQINTSVSINRSKI